MRVCGYTEQGMWTYQEGGEEEDLKGHLWMQ